jgi:hypothetical protein
MYAKRSLDRLARAPCLWGGALLMLLGLVACGASVAPSAAPPELDAQAPATSAIGAPTAPPTLPAPTAVSIPAPSTLPTELPPTEPPTTQPAKLPPRPAAATAPAAAMQGWQTYRNEQAGYSVAYPPHWKATDLPGAPGEFKTSFAPEGGAGIVVAVRPLDPEQREPIDLPNTRCKPVNVGGASGVRCFDTISLGGTTTLMSKDRQFIIATSGKRLDQDTYQRFLDSFKVLP